LSGSGPTRILPPMLTLDVMKRIQLTAKPITQKGVGWILRANYRFPPTATRTRVENFDRIPNRPVYIAMNHTDRFNYWPFQIELWKQRNEFTATWVKGKYYNKPTQRRFMELTNNIPTPSRGYLLAADCQHALHRPPSPELYRLLRDAISEGWEDSKLYDRAQAAGFKPEVDRLFKTPRDILGMPFNPFQHEFVESHRELFRQMMDIFIDLNDEAFDKGLRTIVFPEGTRSVRLGPGKPGLAQMALRVKATIVPVGCNGSDKAYPGNNPFSTGGTIVYRVGEPLTPDGELAKFQIDEAFRPFTDEAHRFDENFKGTTDLVMSRIRDLLDPEYQEGPTTAVEGSDRFL